MGRHRHSPRGLQGSAGGRKDRRRGEREEKVISTPTWMKKLEDRYQRLHRKIAAIPAYQSPASRFNLLTRKFLKDALAKAAVRDPSCPQEERSGLIQHEPNPSRQGKSDSAKNCRSNTHVATDSQDLAGRTNLNTHDSQCTESTHNGRSGKDRMSTMSVSDDFNDHQHIQSHGQNSSTEGLYAVPELAEQASTGGEVCRLRDASPPTAGATARHAQERARGEQSEKFPERRNRSLRGSSLKPKLMGEQRGEWLVSSLRGSVPCRCSCHLSAAGSRPIPPALSHRSATHPTLLPPTPNGTSPKHPYPPPVPAFLGLLLAPPHTPTPLPAGAGGKCGHSVDHSGCPLHTPMPERSLSERDEAPREGGGGRRGPALASGLTDRQWPPPAADGARHDVTGQTARGVACSTGPQQGTVCERGAHSHGSAPTAAGLTARHCTGGGSAHSQADGGVGFTQAGGRRGREDSRAAGLREMGDMFSPVLRTLNPVTREKKKRGSAIYGAQSGSHLPYPHGQGPGRPVPAAVEGRDLPALCGRQGGEAEGRGQRDGGERSERASLQLLPQMSLEARHALRDMGTVSGGDGSQEVSEQGWDDRVEEVVEEEEEEDGDKQLSNSTISLPSLTMPLPSIPLQRRSWHPSDISATHHPHHPLQQHQHSRENSLTASQKTTFTRQKSYRSARQGDTTSSVNTARGAKSPRRSNKRPPSLHTSINVRVDPKSVRTVDTDTERRHGGAEHRGGMDLDLQSVPSLGHDKSNRSSPDLRQDPVQRVHLPAITSRTEPPLKASPRRDNLRHINYRIRGVGSYRVARENTFEITAPGFDIRYREVITCQRGDRETPPPEIFEKSVGKVRDWLNKYYPPSYSPS